MSKARRRKGKPASYPDAMARLRGRVRQWNQQYADQDARDEDEKVEDGPVG